MGCPSPLCDSGRTRATVEPGEGSPAPFDFPIGRFATLSEGFAVAGLQSSRNLPIR
jgi:hypothetical protein